MRLLIAGLAVAAIFLVAAVLIALSWMNSRNLLLDAAARTANDAAQITFEHTRRMIEPASATLRTLSFDPIVSAPRLQDRLERMRLLAEELAANPLISALYVGYDNGDFLLARMLDDPGIRQHFGAPGQARFLVQTVTRAADGTAEGDFLFYDGGLSPITRRSEADYRYDPRERPWYANAGEGAALTISAPYVFFSTRQVGVSLSRRAEGGKAIVGLDIVLDDLGRMLDELRITPSAELALVDGSGAVVAYRDPRVLTARALAAGDTHLRPLDDLGVEPLSDLRRIARDGRPVSYDVAGHEWLGSCCLSTASTMWTSACC
ncbi:cache domain-containing protein [Bordetella pertussis]|nr:cache domain-containing protein [Bordetella pertussis]